MSETTRDNARAALGASATGAIVGLVLTGALLAGQPGRAAAPAPAELTPIATAPAAASAPTIVDTVNRQGARSGQLLKTSLRGPAAKPFVSGAQSDLDCLTAAVYYEARGEGAAGQAAVAQVVLNRVRHPSFPSSVCAVVFQGCQFSFACNGSMSRRKEARAWSRARDVAAKALAGAVAANIGNATHFHTINVSPHWGPNLLRVGQVGLHVFYRFGGRRGAPGAFTDTPRLGEDTPEMPYRRLSPEERVYMTSLTAAKPQDITLAKTGMGGPLGPVTEPASAPAPALKPVAAPKAPVAKAADAAALPAAVEVKASTATTIKSSAAPTSSAAS
ncbi:MAG TPA: cell wall hydrolase [Caulobacteraceae bacterium]